MCGRFTLTATAEDLASHFELATVPRLAPRYNIAPSQPVEVVRQQDGAQTLTPMLWGLIPSWADDPSIGNRMINARIETAAEKPAFRAAFRRRRCLIPATGFYEWTKANGKQPYHFQLPGGGLFAFAGLWETWEKEGGPIESCTILTTEANADVAPVHHRMPVVLSPSAYAVWLTPDEEVQAPDSLLTRIRQVPEGRLSSHPVSKFVNDPRHEGPECIA